MQAPPSIPTLAEGGIDKKLSSRAQKLAAVEEGKFESMVGGWRERVSRETERVTTNLLRESTREPKSRPQHETCTTDDLVALGKHLVGAPT